MYDNNTITPTGVSRHALNRIHDCFHRPSWDKPGPEEFDAGSSLRASIFVLALYIVATEDSAADMDAAEWAQLMGMLSSTYELLLAACCWQSSVPCALAAFSLSTAGVEDMLSLQASLQYWSLKWLPPGWLAKQRRSRQQQIQARHASGIPRIGGGVDSSSMGQGRNSGIEGGHDAEEASGYQVLQLLHSPVLQMWRQYCHHQSQLMTATLSTV